MTTTEQGASNRDAATNRAEAARRRANELQLRRAELAAGLPPSVHERAHGGPMDRVATPRLVGEQEQVV